MVLAKRDQLRAPLRQQLGAAGAWTLTFFPQEDGRQAKSGGFDWSKTIGTTHAAREWLSSVCSILADSPCTENSLLGLSAKRYAELFKLARAAASVEPATPHQMRHGAASADALAGVGDATLLGRGPWQSIKSLRRYRKPARYIRKLHLLSPSQRAAAEAAPEAILHLMNSILKKGL